VENCHKPPALTVSARVVPVIGRFYSLKSTLRSVSCCGIFERSILGNVDTLIHSLDASTPIATAVSRSSVHFRGRFSELVLIKSRMKHRARWTNVELVIVLYFSSRHIDLKSISQLLSHRGFQRSSIAIKHKICEIVRTFPSLRPSAGRWDKDAVDQWLDNTLGNPKDVDRLVAFTSEDAETVAQVGQRFLKDLTLWQLSNFLQNQPIDRILWSPREMASCWGRLQRVVHIRLPPTPDSNSSIIVKFERESP
jgi:hypothetical protein